MATALESRNIGTIALIEAVRPITRRAILTAFLVSLALTNRCSAEEPSVESIGRRLEQSDDPRERESILLLMPRVAKLPATTRLLAPISVCAKDPDAGVRCAAVLALAHISFENKTDCPRSLIAALLDSDAEVRRAAHENIVPDVYATLPANTLEVAEEGLTNEKYRDIRTTCATLLQYYRLNDRATDLLIDALSDRDHLVGNNAAVALYTHGVAMDQVVAFYAEAALAPLERREFYSAKLRWDELDHEFAMVLQSHYRKKLREAAEKYPQSVARLFADRLRSKDQRTVTCALAQIASPSRLSDSLIKELRKPAIVEALGQLTQNPDSQVSDLAQMAKLRLLTTRDPQN